jgi:D-3-phosphoglycerate dehydrogenase
VPETPETKNMIGTRELAQMKPGAALVNAARGTVVDIPALVETLRSGHTGSAALDVFPKEPKAGEEFLSPLREFDNVILTPHIGGSTEEAQRSIGREVALKMVRYSNTGSTLTAVNFPEVSLPEQRGRHRLMHIHRNQPGVMSAVNTVFSSSGINISGQYLETNAQIGYVVIDVDSDERAESLQLKRALDAIPGTLKTRILY